ncbi:MAG: M48 family metallopeptidase [Xanthomonadaceae bacterium]|nr:M48 family metallopeptidase [Xanthomonadaceae bacterium]
MNPKIQLLILSFLFSSPSSHALFKFKSTKIDQVLVQKHSPQTSIHLQINGKGKRKEIIDLPQTSQEENRRYNPPLHIQTIDFHISINATSNLPAGKSLKATLNGKIIFKGKDDFKLKLEPIYIGKTKFKKKKIDCSGLFYISPHMGRLLIKIYDQKGLNSCAIAKTADVDPAMIGQRDLRGDHGNFYTVNQDSVLGAQYAYEFRRQNKELVLEDHHPTTQYVQNMMNKIADSSDTPSVRPQVYVVNANILNAFALPGGHVFVFRGLLDKSQNESEVAGVLGHEWAHVTTRHGTKGMSRHVKIMLGVYTTFFAIGIAGSKSKSELIQSITPLLQYATLIGGQLIMMNASKNQEREADKLGAQYAWKAGYSPSGLGQMFEVFSTEDPSGNSGNFLESAFRSHPYHSERIATNYLYSGFFFPESSVPQENNLAYLSAKQALSGIPSISESETSQVMNAFKESVSSFTDNAIKEKFVELAPMKQ